MSMKAAGTVALEGHRHARGGSCAHKAARRASYSSSSSDDDSSSDDERGSSSVRRSAVIASSAAVAAAPVAAAAPAASQDTESLFSTLAQNMAQFSAQIARLATVDVSSRRDYGAVVSAKPQAEPAETATSQFVATARFKQRFNEGDVFDKDLKRPVLKLRAGKNLALTFDRPEVGEMLAQGKLAAIIEGIEMTVHARDAEDLDITFPTIKTEHNTPLSHTVSMGELVANDGTARFVALDRPFDTDKQKLLEESGAFVVSGNLAKSYTRVPALGFAAVPLESPIGKYADNYARENGLELKERIHDGKVHLELDLKDFDEIYEPDTRTFFARELPIADMAKFGIDIAPQAYFDHKGNSLAASFNHDNPGGEVLLNGECKITLRTFKFEDRA